MVQTSDIVFAVGDIHGRLDCVQSMMKLVEKEVAELSTPASAKLVFLGDYIDRGRNSAQVLDLFTQDFRPPCDVVFVEGNHDRMFLDLIELEESPQFIRMGQAWIGDLGGAETMKSYGISPPSLLSKQAILKAREKLQDIVPASHKEFLKNTVLSHKNGSDIFVHAGLRPGVPVAEQREMDMLWIRQEFLNSSDTFEGHRVIHGHTCTPSPVVCPNRINVDTRAYASGVLTCAVLRKDSIRFLAT